MKMYIFGGGISKNGFMVTRKAKPYFQGDFAIAAAFFLCETFPNLILLVKWSAEH